MVVILVAIFLIFMVVVTLTLVSVARVVLALQALVWWTGEAIVVRFFFHIQNNRIKKVLS